MKVAIKRALLNTRSRFLLKKLSSGKAGSKGPIAFAVVKNELELLTRAIPHYRNLGCSEFVILDNQSDDGTTEYLLEQSDITVYRTSEKYLARENRLSSKLRWMTILLNRHAKNKWCIGFDADELFVYPNSENVNLVDVTDYLEQHSYNALKCVWVDMYSKKSVAGTAVKSTQLTDDCSYFDHNFTEESAISRVFGWRSEFDKTPLFRWDGTISIDNGWHRAHGTARYADFKGVVLHFPFTDRLYYKAKELAGSDAYYNGSAKYKCFADTFSKKPDLSLFYEGSIKFESSLTFYDLGLLTMGPEARDKFIYSRSNKA